MRKGLHWFNFPKLWIDLILSCISSSSLAVLVNGQVTDFFSLSRGIRHTAGRPSIPTFSLCMEYLSATITENVNVG